MLIKLLRYGGSGPARPAAIDNVLALLAASSASRDRFSPSQTAVPGTLSLK